jgi:hypothetical protein
MAKRIKKPLVEPGKRREWFRLYEEEGHSPSKIAKDFGYDVRTVKRAIDLERQEREKKETRYLVLRNATERHYADLCDFAKKLDSQLGSDRITRAVEKEDPLWAALREHLPRSIIWKNLDKWEMLRQEIQQLNIQIEKLLESKIDSALEVQQTSYAAGLGNRFFYALIPHIREAAQARPEILKKFDLEKIPESKDPKIKEIIEGILQEVEGWGQYNLLVQSSKELRQVNRILHDELLVIQMRRVVPGHCRYCPV